MRTALWSVGKHKFIQLSSDSLFYIWPTIGSCHEKNFDDAGELPADADYLLARGS
jgi:hypothetical protein